MTALPSSGQFAMVDPTHVAAVGPAAAILFARIVWRSAQTGEWPATRSELAAETGLSPAMLRTATDVLRAQEWVTAERVSALDSTLVWRPIRAGQAESADSAIPRVRNPLGGGGESAIPSLETGNTTTSPPPGGLFEAPPLRSVPTPSELDAEFVRFWELYPRRTGKKAARAAYGKARRTTSVQAIATGLRAQLPGLMAKEPQYVPHPATWLNQGRWDDELLPNTGPVSQLPPPPRTDLYG